MKVPGGGRRNRRKYIADDDAAAPMDADIAVTARPSMDGWLAEVVVRQGGRASHHRVRVARDAWERLTGGKAPVEDLLRASFEFLLEREPAEAILQAFEVTVIPRYFPEYEKAMQARFGG